MQIYCLIVLKIRSPIGSTNSSSVGPTKQRSYQQVRSQAAQVAGRSQCPVVALLRCLFPCWLLTGVTLHSWRLDSLTHASLPPHSTTSSHWSSPHAFKFLWPLLLSHLSCFFFHCISLIDSTYSF